MFAEYLREEFSRRCRKNPNYSLRAFARALRIDSSSLSAIVNSKRRPTPRVAKRLLDEMGTDVFLKQKILASLAGMDEISEEVPYFVPLKEDQFAIISDWEHFAILSVLETRGSHSVSTISNRLNIGPGTALAALQRLERVGLISKAGKGWITTGQSIATSSDIPDSAVRRNNHQYIEKALFSLENHSVDDRDITGVTMAIDRRKLPEAKKLIRGFRRQLCKFLESGDQTQVYRLNVQLFPIDKR